MECNLVQTSVPAEVGMQGRADAAAHLHGGDLYARASAPHPCEMGIFWMAILIRPMASSFLVLACNCMGWRNVSFLIVSRCFQ